MTLGGQAYVIPWKSVAVGQSDEVMAVTDGTEGFRGVVFRTEEGVRQHFVPPVVEVISGVSQGLSAVYMKGDTGEKVQPVEVGRLNVVAYEPKTVRLTVVPVNGSVFPEDCVRAVDSIKRAYGQAAVMSEIIFEKEGMTVPEVSFDSVFSDDVCALCDYTWPMRAIWKAYKESHGGVISEMYYIFLVRNSKTGKTGYFPFGERYGFVYVDKLREGEGAKALAHELGHGAFRLEHYPGHPPAGTTDNLMDYGRGFRLIKPQWDWIHSPKMRLFSWGEEGEEMKDNLFRHQSGRGYGWLSAEQESGKDAGCALGYDDEGGCSYGKYQLAVRTGTLKDFLNWVNKKISNQYSFFTEEMINESKVSMSKSQCLECEFTKRWMGLCNDEAFNSWQKNYIIETHYKPLQNRIINNFGETKLFSSMSAADEEALIEMCISLGVQHGGAYRIFQMALLRDYRGCSDEQILTDTEGECSPEKDDFPPLNNKNKEQIQTMSDNADQMTMREFVERVYAARKLYVKANNVSGWKSMVLNRYKDEPSILISTLKLK